jgi:hypothetical protein
MPILYDPDANLPGVNTEGMAASARQELAELLNGRIKKHTFFTHRAAESLPPKPEWNDQSAIPSWLVHDPSSLLEQVERRPEIALLYEGVEYRCALDGFRRDFLRLVDGSRTLGEIVTRLEPKYAKCERSELLGRWNAMYEALSLFSLLGLMTGGEMGRQGPTR